MMTGEQYRDSIRDGRVVFYRGKRLDDLQAEPDHRIAVDLVAAGYDRWYRPGPDARHPLMEPPRSVEEMRERIAVGSDLDTLSHLTYVCLGTLVTAAGRLRADEPGLADCILAYVDEARRRDVRLTACITDAKGDRSKHPSQQDDPDAYVRVVDRGPDGVVIRGAKLHITGAAFGHDLMVIPTKRMGAGEAEYSIAATVPVSSPGVQIVDVGFPPRSDRRDQPATWSHLMFDGFVIFNDVFVPTDRVLLDGKPELAAVFAHALGLWERLGGIALMVEQADEIVGLATLIAEANGLAKVPHIREKIDELALHATMLRAGLEAAISNAQATPEGYFYPDELFVNAAKYQGAADYGLMIRHLHDIAGGSVATVPGMADFDNPDVGPNLRKYMSTMTGMDGERRARLFLAIRNLTADEFGGWRQVSMLQSGGGLYAQRLVARSRYDFARARALALKAAGLTDVGSEA